MRMTEEEFRAITGAPPKRSKYNNERPEYYDPQLKEKIRFDSSKERDYYLILKDREKHGEISGLRRQVPYEIQPEFSLPSGEKVKAIIYKADFVYTDRNGQLHIVDVKGMRTEVYLLKKKLLAYKGIYIEEV